MTLIIDYPVRTVTGVRLKTYREAVREGTPRIYAPYIAESESNDPRFLNFLGAWYDIEEFRLLNHPTYRGARHLKQRLMRRSGWEMFLPLLTGHDITKGVITEEGIVLRGKDDFYTAAKYRVEYIREA